MLLLQSKDRQVYLISSYTSDQGATRMKKSYEKELFLKDSFAIYHLVPR